MVEIIFGKLKRLNFDTILVFLSCYGNLGEKKLILDLCLSKKTQEILIKKEKRKKEDPRYLSTIINEKHKRMCPRFIKDNRRTLNITMN